MNARQQQTIATFQNYMAGHSTRYNEWYVGVAADPKARLFNDHAVRERSDAWIFETCPSSREAREIEQHFITQGVQGGPGGGDSTTRSVYAYKISNHTVE